LRRDFFSCSNKNKTAMMMTATSRLTQHTHTHEGKEAGYPEKKKKLLAAVQ
jgi:hypothetical protein